ncbi:hypothetical protein [Polaribacter cellanae]|uniref:Uncharacterized protein n=1 Tax=Polaribacter cellanae TaxID=2818493 RepID=A0A975H6A1_9FLAO|nr:hypothetical protein [Polaribacter cellanae]QTE21778.1 hypothetical protein J3359_13265 [Polaribacter cellanae]
MKACPRCKSVSRHRMRRKGIARLIPRSKAYACDNCNVEYTWISFINRSFKM